jgi:ribulose-5-phosphate 4-epimerase/fuculose-1-phosphate aldolase
MNESALREEMCRVGQSLFDRGYVHGTAGNISVRLDEASSGLKGGGYFRD